MVALSRAARRLGIGYQRLRAAVQAGELPAYRLGDRNVRVLWGDVVRWLRAHRVPASDHTRERVAEILADDAQKETAARA
jgi:excisionase family DNA binding protein